VVAVEQNREGPPGLDDFCDFLPEAAQAQPLTMPPLDRTWAARDGHWHWINVWATWCRPCIEETPLLLQWHQRLTQAGVPLELRFLSVDESEEAVTQFQQQHPDWPRSYRLTDADGLPDWVTAVGLDQGATLPLHVLVDQQGRVRCARSGAVSDDDYRILVQLFEVPAPDRSGS
jgi:thiol-disulfide isomerase/thioredoxin